MPKPFRGQIAVIQRNAIQSWALLRPACEIILFGDEEGTADVAREFRVHHISEVVRNEFGTPLVNSLFETAGGVAAHDLLCYINADIILMSDFVKAVRQVASRKHRFLAVGQRWDVDINQPWDFKRLDWEERLRLYITEHGKLHPPAGSDYFVFPRDVIWQAFPAFAVGRPSWDNWLIYQARALHMPVIDVAGSVMVVHQNHDYAHCLGGETGVWEGTEAKRNLEMAGGYNHVFTLEDATHILVPSGPKLDLRRPKLRRHLNTLPVLFPHFRPLLRLVRIFGIASRPLRLKLGLILNAKRSGRHGV